MYFLGALRVSYVFSDDEKKDLYKGYLADMTDCIEEVKSLLLRKKPVNVIVTVSKVTSLYNRQRVDLLRGKWILKVCKNSLRN